MKKDLRMKGSNGSGSFQKNWDWHKWQIIIVFDRYGVLSLSGYWGSIGEMEMRVKG
jgi:hypothetical protein